MKMRQILSLMIALTLLPPAFASGLMLDTSYNDDLVISDPVIITLVIEKQQIKVKNDPNSASVELDPSLRGKSIDAASFTWVKKAKTYLCKADHLPLRIMVNEQNIHSSTNIHFKCSLIK
jgi:hypothetical protein